jgi:hypothetical protein
MYLKAKNCSKISSIKSVPSPHLIRSIFLYVTDGCKALVIHCCYLVMD